MQKPSRREIRDSAMKLLFETTLRDDPIEELYALAEEIDEIIVNDEVKELVDGTLAHQEELDGIITQYSTKRSISRIPKLNLTVLRLALFEILYDDGTPVNAAVSEALLLAEAYAATADDTRFINGLLGAFVRDYQQKDGSST